MATADLKDIEGIVLREFKYKESSKIIEVFTKDLGKISINCQSVLKQNSKNLSLTNRFILASFTLFRSGKDFYGLREGLVLNPYYKSNKNFDIILYKSAISDLLLRTIDQIQIETVFTLLKNSFEAFENAESNHINIFLGFLLKYISFSGFKPNFKTCGICGKNIRGKYLYFSANESSAICDGCKDMVRDKVLLTYDELVYFNKLLYTKTSELELIKKVSNYQKIGKIIIDYCLKNLDMGIYPSLAWVKRHSKGMQMYFEDLILKLEEYWKEQGCSVMIPYDIEKGAGTMNPHTFLRALGPEPWKVCYVEPSRRPADGRYGENPNRLYQHHQMQILLKPTPSNIQDLYLNCLEAIGIDPKKHDIRFVEDNWESPTLGAWGLGWEVWLDGMEITQFTYFQQVGGINCALESGEITIGLERICMYLQDVDNVYDIKWSENLTYGDVFKIAEYENSKYSFEDADNETLETLFNIYEKEAARLIELGLVYPAYDNVLKTSHAFNTLDAKGAISVSERNHYIKRVRDISSLVAEKYIEKREELGFPLLRKEEHA